MAGAIGLALALVVGARAVSWLVRAVRTKRRLAAGVASGERRTRGSLGFGFGVNGAGPHAEVRLEPPTHGLREPLKAASGIRW